jgi:hypothetical protein
MNGVVRLGDAETIVHTWLLVLSSGSTMPLWRPFDSYDFVYIDGCHWMIE